MATGKKKNATETREEYHGQCQDCLIWIGSGYYETVAKYVSEAKTRGCCRRIPSWPSWAKAGVTRVFLAHRDAFKSPDRGVIFGYFVLHGADIILTQDDCDEYEGLRAKCGQLLIAKQDPKSLRSIARTPEGKKCLEPIVGFWNQRLGRLPFNGPPEPDAKPSRPDGELADDVLDFLLDFLMNCNSEFEVDSLVGYGISTHQTRLEEGRWCGIRTDPERSSQGRPSIYFVDTLTRTIDELFCELLKKLIKDALAKQQNKHGSKGRRLSEKEVRDAYDACIKELKEIAEEKIPSSNRQKGIPEFQVAVKKALESAAGSTTIPPKFEGIAQPRGALVLFNKPYPAFQKAPRAAFLGLLRLDGDRLMNQILKIYKMGQGSRDLKNLPYCEKQPELTGTTSEPELIRQLAQALQMSKGQAGRIMDEFADLIARELRDRDAIRLNRIGTFRIRATNGRRLVKFKVSQSLRSKVASASTAAGSETAREADTVTKHSATKPAYEGPGATRRKTKRTK